MQLAQTILFLYAISYSTPLCNKFFTALAGNFCANSIISYCITFATFILLYYKQRWIRTKKIEREPLYFKGIQRFFANFSPKINGLIIH